MNDAWENRKRALEDSYFEKQNQDAMARLKARKGSEKRLSPITGEPMEQLTLMGVVIDRCPSSGGVWLDAGELEEIIKSAKSQGADQETTLSQFFSNLFNLNSKR